MGRYDDREMMMMMGRGWFEEAKTPFDLQEDDWSKIPSRQDEDPKAKLVDVAGNLLNETGREFLVQAGFITAWLPKKEVEDNKDGTFTMPEWLAKEKGLS